MAESKPTVSFDEGFRKLNQDWWIEIAVQHTLATNDVTSYEDNVRKLETIVFMKKTMEEDVAFEQSCGQEYQRLNQILTNQEAYIRALHWRFKQLMKMIAKTMPTDDEVTIGGEEELERSQSLTQTETEANKQ